MPDITMPNGKIIRGVPEGTSKEQLMAKLEQSGRLAEFGIEPTEPVDIGPRHTGKEFKREELGLIEKTGNLFSDFMKALQVHGESVPQQAARLVQPGKVLNLKGDGFVDRSSEEGKQIRRIERDAYATALHAPEEDDGVSIAAKVTSLLADPVLIAAGSLSMPAKMVLPANATRAHKATAQLTRAAKIFTGGAGIVGGLEGLDQMVESGEIDDPAKLAQALAIGGVGGVVIDRTLAGLGAIFRQPGMTPKKADKLLTKIENQATTLREEGLNPSVAARTAFRDNGIIDPQMMRSVEDLAKRRIDFSKSMADIKLPISTRVYNKLGLNKVTMPDALENYITPLTTRIGAISQKIMGGLRKFEMEAHQGAQELKVIARPFMENFESKLFRQGLSKADKTKLAKAVFNGDAATVRQMSIDKGGTALYDSYLTVRNMLDDTFDRLKAEGFDVNRTANFFPRLVKDLEGMTKAMGKEQGTQLQKAIQEAAGRKPSGVLSQAEMSDVVNKFIRGFSPRIGNKPSVLKERKIDEIPDELIKYYANPVESLVNYIDNVSHSIAKHRFFGMHGTKGPLKRLDSDDTESIGFLISDELSAGNIRLKDADKLRELLQARFIGGEKVPGKFTQRAKNLFYSATLAQPTSAATQLGDLGISAYVNGLVNTVKGIGGKRLLRVDELGIANKIAEEFGTTSGTAKFLNNMLKYSGFKSVDRLGKTANINGAIHKAMGQVKLKNGKPNPREMAKFLQKWEPIFGDDTPMLIQSLRRGKVDDNVKLLAWNTLSDVQPITLSEMPAKYLSSPGGRIFYMLKSFTIKQMDILRRDAFREIAKGNVVKGTTNLARFGMMFTAANMGAAEVKNWMKGRDVPLDDMVVDNLYKNFGLSEYIVNTTGRKGLEVAATDFLAPAMFTMPLGELDAILRNSEDIGKAANSVGKNMPLVGQMYYQWFGGGQEAFEKRQRELRRKQRRDR